ncbi:MAG: hypothetical protein WA322_01730 [Pseudolabrys sp.]
MSDGMAMNGKERRREYEEAGKRRREEEWRRYKEEKAIFEANTRANSKALSGIPCNWEFFRINREISGINREASLRLGQRCCEWTFRQASSMSALC